MVDRITALVVKDSLEAISAEMSKTVERTAVHPLFNEVHDYSTGVFFYKANTRDTAKAEAPWPSVRADPFRASSYGHEERDRPESGRAASAIV